MSRRLLPLVLAAACHAPTVVVAPAAPAPVVPVAPVIVEAAPAPIEVSLQVQVERDGKRVAVTAGDTLHTGDHVELFVDVTAPAYVYVVQFYADGTAAVLYPGEGASYVEPGRGVHIPEPGIALELDEHTGMENVYVLATREPVRRADATIAAQIDEIRRSGGGTATPPPAPAPAPPPATKPAPKVHTTLAKAIGAPVKPDRLLSFASRGIKRVHVVGGTPTISAMAHHDDDLVVLHFAFLHQ